MTQTYRLPTCSYARLICEMVKARRGGGGLGQGAGTAGFDSASCAPADDLDAGSGRWKLVPTLGLRDGMAEVGVACVFDRNNEGVEGGEISMSSGEDGTSSLISPSSSSSLGGRSGGGGICRWLGSGGRPAAAGGLRAGSGSASKISPSSLSSVFLSSIVTSGVVDSTKSTNVSSE